MRGCRMLCFLLVAVSVIQLSVTANIRSKRDAGLYSRGEGVKVLTTSNFYHNLLHKENAWMIEFYSSWCGHCINFAPTYQQFAKNIKAWSRVLSVGAIDCSQTQNIEVCRHYNIHEYPTVLIFPPLANNHDRGKRLRGGRRMNDLLKYAIDFLSDRSQFRAPASWPRLEPTQTINEILPEVTSWKKAAVIFEDSNSITGREVILDTMDQTHLTVRRLLKETVTKYGITQFPALYSLNRHWIDRRLAVGNGGENDRATFDKALKEQMGININIVTESPNKTTTEAPSGDNPSAVTLAVAVHMQDIESALTYSFRQEVAIQKVMNKTALDALRTYILVLAKYLPTRRPLTRFLWQLSDWLKGVGPTLTGEEWTSRINSMQTGESFLPEAVQWTGCHGSKLKFRGYPCSMWTLFHTLTVNSYQSKNTAVPINPQEVLLAISGYMNNFFGCADCVKNFGKMAATMPQEVKQRQDSVLWLWRSHNKANKRLHGQPSEDPLFPKIQFPLQTTCSECHKPGSTNANPIWNEDEVLKYMVQLYRHENIVQDVSKNPNRQRTNNNKGPNDLDWWELHQQNQRKLMQNKNKSKKQKKDKYSTNLPISSSAQHLNPYYKQILVTAMRYLDRGRNTLTKLQQALQRAG